MTTTTRPIRFLDLAASHVELGPELDELWRHVVSSSAFIGGELVEVFEAEWARYCGARTSVGCSSGTDALRLCLAGLGIGPGDEVIVPTNTFIATAAAVTGVGATPVFVDVDPQTLLLTAETVAAAIGPRTAAVMAVHLYGQPVAMDSVRRVAQRAGLAVIADAAQSHGATWDGTRAGTLGDITAYSFYPGKNLGAFGDGGAVVTDDEQLASVLRSLINHGRAAESRYLHEREGWNGRLDALQAGVLSLKLRHLDDWIGRRRRAAAWYDELLAGSDLQPVVEHPAAKGAYHLYVVRVGDREAVRAQLAERGIETGVHYPVPCHRQPAFERFTREPLPVAEATAGEILSLPMHPHLDRGEVERVVTELCAVATGAASSAR